MASFEDRDRGYDLLKWEVEHRFCRDAVTIKNVCGNTVPAGGIGVGYPLNLNGSQYETAVATGEAGVDAIVIDPRKIPELADDEITAEKYQVLVRGPALVNKSAIPTNDATTAATAFTLATLVTRLAALDIQVLVEPATEEIQTT